MDPASDDRYAVGRRQLPTVLEPSQRRVRRGVRLAEDFDRLAFFLNEQIRRDFAENRRRCGEKTKTTHDFPGREAVGIRRNLDTKLGQVRLQSRNITGEKCRCKYRGGKISGHSYTDELCPYTEILCARYARKLLS